MLQLRILTVGKIKEKWLDEAISEYVKRLRSILCVDFVLFKDEKSLEKALLQEKFLIIFDKLGKLQSSEEFSKTLIKLFETRGGTLVVGIGGSEGFSSQIHQKSNFIFSLSLLTFTHQITRLIIIEQIYRAFEINKGTPYHK